MAALISELGTDPLGFAPTLRQRELWQTVRMPLGKSGDAVVLAGYGGAMGGGKTRALAELALDTAQAFPGTRILVARLRYTDLYGTTMREFLDHCPVHLIAARRRSSPEQLTVSSREGPGAPSTIQFRHLTDWTGLGSQEYGAVFIDEAGEVSEEAARMLVTRLRHPAQPIRLLVAASNPWPGWFERWFVRRELPLDRFEEADLRLDFIPARIRDNPHLPDNYERLQRAMLSEDWVERFVDGRFDAFMGLVYTRFDRVIHRWDEPLPPFARYVGGLDFGGLAEHHHKTAGIVAGLTDRRAARGADILIRLAEFESGGHDVIARLEAWMRHCAARFTAGAVRRIVWRADRSQGAWIDRLARQGFAIAPADGGPHSVHAGIELVRRRLDGARSNIGSDSAPGAARSYYLPSLTIFPERMSEYHWEPPDASGRSTARPVKEDDDLLDADRYMHEAADDLRRALHAGGAPQRVAIGRAEPSARRRRS